MNDSLRGTLRFLAAQFVFVAALVHLGLGVFKWLEWLQAGFLLPRDVRWPLFVLSGLAILAGMYLADRSVDPRPYYAAGVVVMLGYVVAYFGWHVGGHRPLLFFGQGAGHDAIDLEFLLDHLFAGPVEFLAIVVEVAAAATLAALLLDGR